MVPVEVRVDLTRERVLRALVQGEVAQCLGTCRREGRPYQGPEVARAVAIAESGHWPPWKPTVRPCDYCGEGVRYIPELQKYGPHVEANVSRLARVAHIVPVSCFVSLEHERVFEVIIWDELLELAG